MEDIIKQLIEQHIPLTIDIGIVKKIKGDVAHVESRTTEKDFFNCRINAIESNENNKLKITPAEGSSVVIGIFKGTEKAIILSVSEVATIEYQQDTTKFKISAEGYEITRDEISFKTVLNEVLTEVKNLAEELKKVTVSIGVTVNVPVVEAIITRIDSDIKPDLNKILK